MLVATFGLLKSTIWRTFAIPFFQMYVLSPEKRRVSNGRERSDDFLPPKSQTSKKTFNHYRFNIGPPSATLAQQ